MYISDANKKSFPAKLQAQHVFRTVCEKLRGAQVHLS